MPPILGEATEKLDTVVPLVIEMPLADMPKIYFCKVTV